MKKLVIAIALFTTALGFSQEPEIRTQKVYKTRVRVHDRLYAEAEIGQDSSEFVFRCEQFRQITILKGIKLNTYDTERLYRALRTKEHHKGDVIDIPTMDNKLVHIEWVQYMFSKYPMFDIIDKENDAIFHIWCIGDKAWDILFNKI
jgi:hypothetical protein